MAGRLGHHVQDDLAHGGQPPAGEEVFRPPGRRRVKCRAKDDGMGAFCGWVEGAIESGLRAARQIDPDASAERGSTLP